MSQPDHTPDQHRDDLAEDRKEVGNQASSTRHPPHVTENEEGEQVQEQMVAPGDAAVLPANASGSDKVSADEQREGIDDESMYDRRPSRDKDHPPSEGTPRTGG